MDFINNDKRWTCRWMRQSQGMKGISALPYHGWVIIRKSPNCFPLMAIRAFFISFLCSLSHISFLWNLLVGFSLQFSPKTLITH